MNLCKRRKMVMMMAEDLQWQRY